MESLLERDTDLAILKDEKILARPRRKVVLQ